MEQKQGVNFKRFSFLPPAFEEEDWTSNALPAVVRQDSLVGLPSEHHLLLPDHGGAGPPCCLVGGRGRGSSGSLAPALSLAGSSRSFVQHASPSPAGRRSVCWSWTAAQGAGRRMLLNICSRCTLVCQEKLYLCVLHLGVLKKKTTITNCLQEHSVPLNSCPTTWLRNSVAV